MKTPMHLSNLNLVILGKVTQILHMGVGFKDPVTTPSSFKILALPL